MAKTKSRKKMTRKQKSRLNKAAFRAKNHKRKATKARSSKRRSTTKRRSVKRAANGRFVRKGSKRRSTKARKSTKRKSVRARYRTGSMGERIRVNPRRRNPGSTLRFSDGGIVSAFRSGRSVHVTVTSPYGESHEYETTSAVMKKLARAKSTSAARRILGGSTLRHINPGRRIVRGHRMTGGCIKRTAKGRFARR